jgi:hypothetical protein
MESIKIRKRTFSSSRKIIKDNEYDDTIKKFDELRFLITKSPGHIKKQNLNF